jgi:hypothetical protein
VSTEFYWLAVVVTTIVSASRLTRLATWDKFPPVVWLRDKYADATDGGGWQLLAFCGYCASFWITALVVAWGWQSGVYSDFGNADAPPVATQVWWVINGIFAASYLAAILMVHDGDEGDD